MTNAQTRENYAAQPARSIEELEQRERLKRSVYGLSLWKLLLVLNFLGFAAGIARFLWGRQLEDAIVTFVLIGALAPMAILAYQTTVLIWDRFMPRAFHSPVHDDFDVETEFSAGDGADCAFHRDQSDD